MLELVIIIFAMVVLHQATTALAATAAPALAPKRTDPKLAQLQTYADRLYTEHKWLAAEKAYVSVLKIDHKNVTAYNHLGIIYSTQKNMPDAIECFQIATRLRPSGTTYQNLALAYYDNKNYIKSIAAYEKAIMFEPHAQRYVGLGKAQLKLHNTEAAITAYEQAAALEPTKRILERLADAYKQAGRTDAALEAQQRIAKLGTGAPKPT